jgi:hypothetical protein
MLKMLLQVKMSELLNLPDLALERVLLYVGVESLLRNFVRVNRYMYNFMHSHPTYNACINLSKSDNFFQHVATFIFCNVMLY